MIFGVKLNKKHKDAPKTGRLECWVNQKEDGYTTADKAKYWLFREEAQRNVNEKWESVEELPINPSKNAIEAAFYLLMCVDTDDLSSFADYLSGLTGLGSARCADLLKQVRGENNDQ